LSAPAWNCGVEVVESFAELGIVCFSPDIFVDPAGDGIVVFAGYGGTHA